MPEITKSGAKLWKITEIDKSSVDNLSFIRRIMSLLRVVVGDLYGNHHHWYVGMEQQPVGERRIEQACKDVLLLVGYGDEVDGLSLLDGVEVLDDRAEREVGHGKCESRIV